MKDFNFFEPYLDKRKISTYNILILYAVGLVVVLGMIIYPLVNIFRINSLKKSVAAMKENLESSAIYERLSVVEQKKEKVSEMEEKLSLLENVDKIIESRDVINDLLLDRVTGRVPKDVFFRSLSLSSGQIQIQGSAINNLAVAHLESNLKSDKGFKDIYISNISLDEGLHNFSINFALKDAEEDDTEQGDAEQNDDTEQKDVGQNGTE
ncbi:MAG: PilN domain-containing protein [Natronincolaceae bacterium]|jgi:type IV pilus assembly protein PilN